MDHLMATFVYPETETTEDWHPMELSAKANTADIPNWRKA